jgi:hypothetical protein
MRVILSVVMLALGCSRKAPSTDAPAGAASSAFAPMTFGPITVDDARPLLPRFAGARELHELRKAEGREQIAWNLCFAKRPAAEIERDVITALTALGWESARFVDSEEHGVNKRVMTAHKPPLHLTGELAPAPAFGCDPKQGETLIGLLMYRLVPRATP